MSACEILSLYSEINIRCIENGKSIGEPKNRHFVDLTRIMNDVKDILKGFKIQIKTGSSQFILGQPREIPAVSFWSLYSQEEIIEITTISALYDMKGLPKIVPTDDLEAKMKKFNDLIEEFKEVVADAVQPYRCCLCLCRTSYVFYQKEIFGTLDQLRFMLEKNFDGRHFWV